MDAELRKRLKVYKTIDNDHRLSILVALFDEPDIAFNDLARKTEIERGLLAYHMGVMKNVGLVKSEYERRSKKSSKYRLTEEGIKVIKEFKLDEISAKKRKE